MFLMRFDARTRPWFAVAESLCRLARETLSSTRLALMTVFSRSERLGEHFTPLPLDAFTKAQALEPVDITSSAGSPEDVLAAILAHKKWRHHHGIPELEARSDLYTAYVRRIEEILALIHGALERHDLIGSLGTKSIVDLAAAEGFMSSRFIEWGATHIDAVELSKTNLDRFALIWNHFNYNDKAKTRLFRFDLSQVAWAEQLEQTYDIVMSLGIIYHVENPALFARNCFQATNDVCIIESDTPVFAEPNRFRGNGVVYLNKDQVTLEAGNVRKLLEFRPDAEALIDILLTAGFSTVELLQPDDASKDSYYGRGEKSVFFCRK